MDKNNQSNSFEVAYSFFILVFGLIIIVSFIYGVAYLIAIFNIMFLFYCWPILVGIWIGLVKKPDKGYELELDKKHSKKLEKIIESIVAETGQKLPHKILISDDSGIAVTGLFRKKLIIGLATLQLLDEKDIKAIIAHEYGHFARSDTVMGYFTYRIQRFFDIQAEISKQNISFSIMIVVYLPTFLLFWIISQYYNITGLWYSRRIEYRADAFAAEIVGKQNFGNALVKYCMISEIFERQVPNEVIKQLEQGRRLINVYDYMIGYYNQDNLDKALKFTLDDKSGWLSTHPSISERLEVLDIKNVDIEFKEIKKDLILNQEKYEKEASEILAYKWAMITQMVQEQDEDDEQPKLIGYCAKCDEEVFEGEIKCSDCKSLLARDGAVVRGDD